MAPNAPAPPMEHAPTPLDRVYAILLAAAARRAVEDAVAGDVMDGPPQAEGEG